jgi:Cu2+-exporting ATPase
MVEHQRTDKHGGHDSSNALVQHESHNMPKTDKEAKHGGHTEGKGHEGHEGGDYHAHMVADFRRRFWISLGATVPILVLSPMIQAFLGFKQAFGFSGDAYVL